jgi:hypothetical protein
MSEVMGKFATNLAAYAANVDKLPNKDKLPRVSFWEAVLPGGLSDPAGKPSKKEKKVRLALCYFYLKCSLLSRILGPYN